MAERIKNLNKYQKGFLAVIIAMVLIFTVVYAMTISRVGFAYKDAILVPSEENGVTVYSGKLEGQKAQFTVSEDNSVVFQYGDKPYGPYTSIEDPAAIPQDHPMKDYMTGVELYEKGELIFRGAYYGSEDARYLYNEDGTFDSNGFSIVIDGVSYDGNGNVNDSMEPSKLTILKLMNNPELTHKGDWLLWFFGVVICIVNILTILYADELFRWNLMFQIRNVESAEPSDWEIFTRYIGWATLIIIAVILFYMGITEIYS